VHQIGRDIIDRLNQNNSLSEVVKKLILDSVISEQTNSIIEFCLEENTVSC